MTELAYPVAPDLVVEVVSPDDPDRDYIAKRKEYAQAGIAEYWIIDPEVNAVEVLVLGSSVDTYDLANVIAAEGMLTSKQLPGFEISLAELFAPEK